jgi:hypothetical protein
MKTPGRETALVIAERGSDSLAWFERFSEQSAEVVLVQQQKNESAADFATRVRTRVEEIDAAGQSLTRAVIAGAGRMDKAVLQARSLVIRAVVGPMVRAGGGEVVLDSTGPDRFSMQGLAMSVAEMLRGTGVALVPSNEGFPLAAVA